MVRLCISCLLYTSVLPPFTYLLEVKYAKAGASEKEIRALADEAVSYTHLDVYKRQA